VCSDDDVGDFLFRQLRLSIHWKAKMFLIAQEHDEGADDNTVEQWKKDVEAWQENHKHKPVPYEEPVLGACFILLIT
jgi:hypothetical protein